jgi:hypothetical protein
VSGPRYFAGCFTCVYLCTVQRRIRVPPFRKGRMNLLRALGSYLLERCEKDRTGIVGAIGFMGINYVLYLILKAIFT